MRRLPIALLVFAAFAIAQPASADAEPKTDEEKAFYAFGFNLSQQLAMLNLTPSEFELVKAGLTDGTLKKPAKADVKEFYTKFQQIAREVRIPPDWRENQDAVFEISGVPAGHWRAVASTVRCTAGRPSGCRGTV